VFGLVCTGVHMLANVTAELMLAHLARSYTDMLKGCALIHLFMLPAGSSLNVTHSKCSNNSHVMFYHLSHLSHVMSVSVCAPGVPLGKSRMSST
jgi:hypothetical protein